MEWGTKGTKIFAKENNANIRAQIELQFSFKSVELLTLLLRNTTTTTILDSICATFLRRRARTPFLNSGW